VQIARRVTLVLCLPDGTVLGSLPPLEVDFPWWQEAWPVVDAARTAHGIAVTVLRLLHGTPTAIGTGGGRVTYLAEVSEPPRAALAAWTGDDPLADHPLRMPWARPGGPAADLAWADSRLEERGTPRTGPARQNRTWNLSSLWRLPLAHGAVWLKVVPPFFAHEPRVLELLDTASVPRLLAHEDGRMLLAEIPGDDRYAATGVALTRMVALLVSLQSRGSPAVDDLLALGAPDWRPPSLAARAATAVEDAAGELALDERRRLERLVGDLTERFVAIASCGLPDTLVHGDFHPGNVRGPDEGLVLLDWGDSGAGHPLLDRSAFLGATPEGERGVVAAEWDRLWRAAVPGCEPERAARLLEPVGALRQVIVYRTFLDAIEPSERVYHAADPAHWLRRAAGLATT
jgi:hypothetical protein